MDSYMSRNFMVLLRLYNVTLGELEDLNRAALKRKIKETHGQSDWRIPLLRELLYCKDGLLDCDLTHEELLILIKHVCVF